MRRALLGATALAVLAATVAPPLDAAARSSLVAHMIQHLAHVDVVPPLLLAAFPKAARAARGIPPGVTLGVAIAAIWAVHLSPLFNASLTSAPLHLLALAIFLAAGWLFWAPVFDEGRLGPIGAAIYVFVAMPLVALLGFAIYTDHAAIYPAYVYAQGGAEAALADQRSGAELMWVGGSLIMLLGFVLVVREARLAARES